MPKEKNRLLHTMMRVKNLEESINFYCGLLGMKVLRKKDYPGGNFTNCFIGFGNEDSHTVLELTHNWGDEKNYSLGDAWGHIAISARDIYKMCKELDSQGVKITREPGPMKHGTTIIAFIEDPDGHKIELIERD